MVVRVESLAGSGRGAMAGVCALPPRRAAPQPPESDEGIEAIDAEQKSENVPDITNDETEKCDKNESDNPAKNIDINVKANSEKETEESTNLKETTDADKDDDKSSRRSSTEKQNSPSNAQEMSAPVNDDNVAFKDDASGESETEGIATNADADLPVKTTAEKRPLQDDSQGEECPSKKLCQELQDSFTKHDTTLSEYISSLSCNNDEELNKHTENLMAEIEVLRELANAKEVEWNHLLHLRKVKEEILLRVLRKRSVLSIEKTVSNMSEFNKELINRQILELNKTCVDDKNDEVQKLKHKPGSVSGNGVQLNSSGLMMVPVSTAMYCQANMNNFGFDNHMNLNPYGNKNMLHKPMMMPPGHRMQDFPMPDINGQASRFNQQMGRQGPIKDVQSIIADHRQRHPEMVPRRGRRMKSLMSPQMPPRMPGPHTEPSVAELGLLFGGVDTNPHLPSIDAVSLQNSIQQGGMPNGMSFKDVLVQFANMTGPQQPGCMGARLPPPPPYPEVTLHPVGVPPSSIASPFSPKMTQQQQTNSLLHGILTKSQPRQDSRFSTFSPTLARLLTAPEKNLASNNTCRSGNMGNPNNFISQKGCSEITITAVQPPTSNNNNNNSNQALNRHQPEPVQLEDFEETELEDDSADRPLVIDESGRSDPVAATRDLGGGSVELGENEVPECQGCRRREAQFVCAGCANQWYCSRDCQVSAWDDHSEVCSG